jgi:cyclic-di-AMP phosphodiesterase PgpH
MKRRSSGEFLKLARQERIRDTSLRQNVRAILFAVLLLVSWSATFILYASPDRVRVTVGDPSPRDIKSSRQLTYVSDVKTREARLAAAATVQDVYAGPDMELGSKQLLVVENITNYITAIRHDQYAEQGRKLDLLREIPTLQLTPDILTKILEFDDQDWQAVINETLRVLDLIMREEIRDTQINTARLQVRRLISHALSENQQTVVVSLTQSLIVPNSFYDADQTTANREAARAAVEPVTWTIREGESILREGEIVSDLALEKLQVLGMLKGGMPWQDRLGVILFSLVIVVVLSVYVVRSSPLLLGRPRREFLLVLTLIVVGLIARMTIPGRTLAPYLFPAAAVTMLVTILLDVQIAMFVSAVVAVLVGYNAGGSIELVVYALVGGMIGGLAIWHMDHLGNFVRAAGYVALANMVVILAFRLPNRNSDTVALFQLLGMGFTNAVLSSSLTFVAFSFIGRLFGITTSLQLLELARPTHPLFRQLLIKSPGTYHHSIIISNMAERAAEAIGADALLARVGSYYHDVGKTMRPYFFAENQSDGENPHDKLDPRTSAEIIIAHTSDGLTLAHKYGLPDRICDFVSEHHGTTLVTYFYRRANQNSQQEVHEDDFRYPGPRPQSKETAIVMLADGIEALVRANRPGTQAEMERLIKRLINDRLVSGQLDESDITLRDLDKIREAFISVLQGIFHPRIQYPDRLPRRVPQDESVPASQ